MQLIAVMNGKGGGETTTIAAKLAISMSIEAFDVMLFDATLGLKNKCVGQGMLVQRTLEDLVAGTKAFSDIVGGGPEGLWSIAAASDVSLMMETRSIHQERLSVLISDQVKPPDVLIVDLCVDIDQMPLTFLAACQMAVLVVYDEPTSMIETYALMKVLRVRKHVRRFEILIDQVDANARGEQLFVRLADVSERYLDVELGYLGTIPTDKHVYSLTHKQKVLVPAFSHSPVAKPIGEVVGKLTRRLCISKNSNAQEVREKF